LSTAKLTVPEQVGQLGFNEESLATKINPRLDLVASAIACLTSPTRCADRGTSNAKTGPIANPAVSTANDRVFMIT